MTADPTDQATVDTATVAQRLRNIRGFVFDLDGTLVLGDKRNHGITPLPGALELTAALTARGIPWLTFTNGTTRTPEAYAQTLREIGFDLPDDAVLTPATSAVEHFTAMGHRSAVVLGGEGLLQPLRRAGIETVAPKGKPQADAVLVGWYREFTMDDLEAACHAVLDGAVLYSCSQSVYFATSDGKALATSRAICAMITSVTGTAEVVVGKPSLIGLKCAAGRLRTAPQDLAVVGDDPELEIVMARRANALAIAVATGIHTADRHTALHLEQSPHITVEGVGELISLLPAAT